MELFTSLRRSVEKRAAYNRTLRELRAMPLETALDVDLDPANAERIARQAVYGV